MIDAFAILIQKQKDMGSKVTTIMNELRQAISNFSRRERKQKESIKEVLDYCRGEIEAQAQALQGNIHVIKQEMKQSRE